MSLSLAWVHPLCPPAWQVQTPQVDLANGILKHFLLFVLGPENCSFLAFPHCLFGFFYSSLSQGDKGDCDLLLSGSFGASGELLQALHTLTSRSSTRTIKAFIPDVFLSWSCRVLHLKVSILQHQHAQSA